MRFRKSNYLGVGVNFRTEVAIDLIKYINEIDFIEINTERFFLNDKNSSIQEIISLVPIVLHGLTLSIGSDQSLSQSYVHNLTKVLNTVECEWFSEHIAVTNVGDIDIRALTPVTFDEVSMNRIVNKVNTIKSLTTKIFLLENITYYYLMPNNEYSEVEFIKNIVEKSDCGLLLDINNLYVNSVNHGYDPYQFLDALPLDRVMEVHLAGCDYIYDMLIDTHASRIKNEVLSLFEYVCKKTTISGVVIERDAKLDNFLELVDEIKYIRNIMKKFN